MSTRYLMLSCFALYMMTKCTDIYHAHIDETADNTTLMVYSLYLYAFIYFTTMCSATMGSSTMGSSTMGSFMMDPQ